jgi:pyrimidine deaminase RibD-like protein/riboflavin biosynthesis pyrimidine reductase
VTADSDAQFIREAYRAAVAAVGNSDPNPAVGAVVVSSAGEILARGATQRTGHAHAERHALNLIPGTDLSAATLYVTLEPCCHHGRTPPCVDIILERKLKRVVIAERDFAAEVMGRSVQMLEGHKVDVSLLEPAAFATEAWLTTGPFFFARKHKRPRITLKWAQTSDGALGPATGPSGPISGKTAASVTAALRSFHKLTLATPGVIAADKPRLNVRFDSTVPDLEHTGLSDFFQKLLLAQREIAAGGSAPEGTQVKPATRGFLAAAMNPLQRGEFYHHQSGIDSNFKVFAYLPEVWRGDFPGAMQSLLSEILDSGYNNILVEAGPGFSELLLQHDFADAVAVYRSQNKTATDLWGKPGRGNSFSHAMSSGAPRGFQLMEQANLGEDDFFFYRRTR